MMNSIEKIFDLSIGNGEFSLPMHECLYKSLVQKSAKHLQAHESMVVMGLLGALSCAAQGAYDVERPSGAKNIPVSLYLLTIADPSERKTSVDDYFFKPLRDFESKNLESHLEENYKYHREYKKWDLERKVIEKEFIKSIKNEDEESRIKFNDKIDELLKIMPVKPVGPRFIYDDTTPEALLEDMYNNRSLACLVTSEANSVLNGRALTALHHINSLWSKSGARIDRISKPSFFLDENARLTLALMTQNSVVKQFIESKGEKAKGTGFLSRMLVSSPPRLSGTRSYSLDNEVPKPEEYEKYKERILKLITQVDKIWNSKVSADPLKPEVLRFNDSAKRLWREYADQIEERQNIDGIYYFATDHAGKLMENITRVAALMHLLENDDLQISELTLESAYNLVLQLSANYMVCFCPKPDLVKKVERLVHYLFMKSKQEKMAFGMFTNIGFKINREEVLRYGPNELRKASELDKAITILKKMGHINDYGAGPYLYLIPFYNRSTIKNGYGFLVECLPPYQRLGELCPDSMKNQASFTNGLELMLLSEKKDEAEKEKEIICSTIETQIQCNSIPFTNYHFYDRKNLSDIVDANAKLLNSINTENMEKWVRDYRGF